MKNVLIVLFLIAHVCQTNAQEDLLKMEPTKLAVVWTSGDKDVAEKVCMMYTHAAKTSGWFDEVSFIVWGPSSKLLTEDQDLQAKVKAMMNDGVVVEACIACANMYGIADKLRELGMEVKPMGKPLSEFLKDDEYRVLTF